MYQSGPDELISDSVTGSFKPAAQFTTMLHQHEWLLTEPAACSLVEHLFWLWSSNSQFLCAAMMNSDILRAETSLKLQKVKVCGNLHHHTETWPCQFESCLSFWSDLKDKHIKTPDGLNAEFEGGVSCIFLKNKKQKLIWLNHHFWASLHMWWWLCVQSSALCLYVHVLV